MALTIDSRVLLHHGSKSSIPLLGFGTYLCSTDEAQESCLVALRAGYRHIDTAEFYNNHEGIAAAIELSGLARDQVFITDKISPGGIFGAADRTFDETKEVLKHHLKRLNIDYVDLYLLHHAFAKTERINQYRALLELQKDGLIKEVGVSNWNIAHIEEIKAAGLPLPSANQIEIHPLCTQSKLIAYLNEHKIVPIAYSSLAPLSTWRTAEGQMSAKTQADAEPSLVQSLSAKHGKSEAQILLRWVIQHGYPALPKVRKTLLNTFSSLIKCYLIWFS